jgi:hypothetical protein
MPSYIVISTSSFGIEIDPMSMTGSEACVSAGGAIGSVSCTATVVVVEFGTHAIGVVVLVVVELVVDVVVDVVDVDGATVVVVGAVVVVVVVGAAVVVVAGAGAVVGAAASAAGSLDPLQADPKRASAASEAVVRIARRFTRRRSVPPIHAIMSGIHRLWGSFA